ncbi:DUF3579 domain-containing protein [sulfur-oxidizing endosymbiont of Gigantopelta aegis]|uniref:DUF3579 domain-containing protein n=1 Tax=sulfur-oxidizing endosymbiont of Gigantopelta aegis TaxID=2794934 RepID=UPI0018DD2B42|nr:DUF3579 domain-containing protein [sulfur-oxidizing endosymbiont of Gigantopelta aegis]
MSANSERIIIEGIKEDGNKFRPSDWCERLATTLASFGEDQRLHYCKSAHPCIINGVNCLIVDRDLETKSPDSFTFLMAFASENKLRVQEDRRQEEQQVNSERRSRRVLA